MEDLLKVRKSSDHSYIGQTAYFVRYTEVESTNRNLSDSLRRFRLSIVDNVSLEQLLKDKQYATLGNSTDQ